MNFICISSVALKLHTAYFSSSIARNLNKVNEAEPNQGSSDSDASDFSGGLSFSDRAKTRIKTKLSIGQETSYAGTEETLNDGKKV